MSEIVRQKKGEKSAALNGARVGKEKRNSRLDGVSETNGELAQWHKLQ